MKFITSSPAFLLVPLLIYSCSGDNKKSSKESGAVSSGYTLIVSTKAIDSTKSGNIFYLQNDTSSLDAAGDSAAYLKAAVKYGSYVADWKMSTSNKKLQPVSFKVINEKKEDVLLKLGPSQKAAIDSVAAMVIQEGKNVVYDSTNNIRNINNNKTGLGNTPDSILKTKPGSDRLRKDRNHAGGSTYIPI